MEASLSNARTKEQGKFSLKGAPSHHRSCRKRWKSNHLPQKKERREFVPSFWDVPPEAIPIRTIGSGRKATKTRLTIFDCNHLATTCMWWGDLESGFRYNAVMLSTLSHHLVHCVIEGFMPLEDIRLQYHDHHHHPIGIPLEDVYGDLKGGNLTL